MAKRAKKVEGTKPSVKRTYKKKSIEGIGDIVEKITEATGIKQLVGDCFECAERKFLLNRLFPFKRVTKLMTEEHKQEFILFLEECGNRVLENRVTDITNHVPFLNSLYAEYFGITIDICENCSGIHKAIIKDLNKLFSNS
jgi:hypothetical protein